MMVYPHIYYGLDDVHVENNGVRLVYGEHHEVCLCWESAEHLLRSLRQIVADHRDATGAVA